MSYHYDLFRPELILYSGLIPVYTTLLLSQNKKSIHIIFHSILMNYIAVEFVLAHNKQPS